LGQPKQLLSFRGRSLLRHAAETALASVCRPVVVVLGAFAERLNGELSGLPVTVAMNLQWAEGMSSSIRAGLKALAAESAGPNAVVIMLCDQPLVSAQFLNRLVAVHQSSGKGIGRGGIWGRRRCAGTVQPGVLSRVGGVARKPGRQAGNCQICESGGTNSLAGSRD